MTDRHKRRDVDATAARKRLKAKQRRQAKAAAALYIRKALARSLALIEQRDGRARCGTR
jgi:hypothetical protein